MTDLPTSGGSYVRDPETGQLHRRSQMTDADDPPERNLLGPEPEVVSVADVAPAGDPSAAPEEPAPAKRRSTSKGGI